MNDSKQASPAGPEKVAEAVLKDPIVKAAIQHVGVETTPGRLAAEAAEQSETSLRTEGQRTVSMIWETTQQKIALMTVGGAMLLAGAIVLIGHLLKLRERRKDCRLYVHCWCG